ncbi:hypothetical protein [Ruminococcus sp.]|uniref:putative ABC transporter permease n=1 Tax=Ruminococcus sp. TaxID=41978 RepID=UPI001B030665|nr:hypothetical protein [Ruminococcus sp.]MBO5559763.1 hypothetical protein [Ruminococcus sp.]
MIRFWKLFAVAAFGALAYGAVEVVERGYSHISMGLLGAAAMVVIHELNGERRAGRLGLISSAVISMLFITSGELLAGEILNRHLGMKIWNYHSMPFNFDGQICLRYSLAWLVLSYLGMAADGFLRRFILCEVSKRADPHRSARKYIRFRKVQKISFSVPHRNKHHTR